MAKSNDRLYLSIIGGLLMAVLLMMGGTLKWYLANVAEEKKEIKESNKRQWQRISETERQVIILETLKECEK
tara:strand:- start:1312 stop:1527 length:216 start_codon:yes stop_codon:yes gene_type:complete